MSGLIFLLVPVAALVVLSLLATRFGADSRPEFEDPRVQVRSLA